MNKTKRTVLGTAMVAAFVAASVQASIVYVDIDTGNTEQWDGVSAYTTFAPIAQAGAADGLWDQRAFANNGTIMQNAGTGITNEDAVRLKTTVSGLASDTYNVFAYFWTDVDGSGVGLWQLEAALTDNVGGELAAYAQGDAGVAQWYTANVGATLGFARFSDDSTVNGGVNPFTTAVMVAEGNRRLQQVSLGQVTGTEISVFLDDVPNFNRTWLDGIGYEAIPEPATIGLIGVFGAGLMVARRRFMI